MNRNEQPRDGNPLDPQEQQVWDHYRKSYSIRERLMGSAKDAYLGNRKIALGVTAVLAGSLVALAGGYVGYDAGNKEEVSTADIRAAAFKNPNVLMATGTCALELDVEAARLSALSDAQRAADTQHPSADVYRQAIQIAQAYNVPCLPQGNGVARGEANLGSLRYEVAGSTLASPSLPSGEARPTPLLDQGSALEDVCNGYGWNPDYDRAPDFAQKVGTLRDAADQYCPPQPNRSLDGVIGG